MNYDFHKLRCDHYALRRTPIIASITFLNTVQQAMGKLILGLLYYLAYLKMKPHSPNHFFQS